MHLVGFIIIIYHDARSSEYQKRCIYYKLGAVRCDALYFPQWIPTFGGTYYPRLIGLEYSQCSFLRNVAIYQLLNAERRNLPIDLESYYCQWRSAGGANIFLESTNHLKIIDAKRVSLSTSYSGARSLCAPDVGFNTPFYGIFSAPPLPPSSLLNVHNQPL